MSKKTKRKDPNRIGDISEIRACAWLLENGYEVFRNVCSTGSIDIVAFKKGEILKIDVKTVRFDENGVPAAGVVNAEDVLPLYFEPKRGEFGWDLNKWYLKKRYSW